MTETASGVVEVGQRGFDAFKHGIETGDAGPLLEVAADDIVFSVALWGEWAGPQRGKDRLKELVDHQHNVLKLKTRVTQTSRSVSEDRVWFEFSNDGTNLGGEYHGRLAVVFQVEDGKVKAFREYAGVLNPAWFGPAVADAASE